MHRRQLLQTATANNSVLPAAADAADARYRFALDASRSLPAGRAREAMMDANPWTYQVMAKEMARKGKLESPASPDTPALSDQRNYLYAEVTKTTTYPVAPAPGSWVGVALAVQLRGSDRWYTSHHDVPDWSIQRDDPAATTIELPAGRRRRRSRRSGPSRSRSAPGRARPRPTTDSPSPRCAAASCPPSRC